MWVLSSYNAERQIKYRIIAVFENKPDIDDLNSMNSIPRFNMRYTFIGIDIKEGIIFESEDGKISFSLNEVNFIENQPKDEPLPASEQPKKQVLDGIYDGCIACFDDGGEMEVRVLGSNYTDTSLKDKISVTLKFSDGKIRSYKMDGVDGVFPFSPLEKKIISYREPKKKEDNFKEGALEYIKKYSSPSDIRNIQNIANKTIKNIVPSAPFLDGYFSASESKNPYEDKKEIELYSHNQWMNGRALGSMVATCKNPKEPMFLGFSALEISKHFCNLHFFPFLKNT